jgi:hypothetical protein
MMTAVQPRSREEVDFVKAFAAAINHATAVVAADPQKVFPAGTIAERVRQAYKRFRPGEQHAIQQRAKERLSGSSTIRREYFGVWADRGADAWSHAEPGLDADLQQQLKQSVFARLDSQRGEIAESLAPCAAAEFHGAASIKSKTTLEVGYFVGDAAASWKELTITAPTSIDLRWATTATGAERGVWQLFRSLSGQQEVLLGTGHAGAAPGGIFSINLAQFLSPSVPYVPRVYRIRVTPSTAPKGRLVPKAVGPPSNDVIITYSSTITPPVTFEIFEIYHHASFVLESIYMVEDQNGSGSEQFHVAGLVQESLPASSGQPGAQSKFGPFFAELDPDGPRSKDLSQSATFFMNKPSDPEWPRSYTTIISVLEEDDGGSLSEWQSSVWDIANEMASGAVGQAIKDYLQDHFKEYIGDNLGQIIHDGGEFAQMLINLIASTVGAFIGMVVAAAALVISDIVSGMSDDYYGTEAFVLVLPTNITDWVDTLPGALVPGGYRLDTEVLEFRGYTSWPEATAFDGVVDVYFHWEFGDKGMS